MNKFVHHVVVVVVAAVDSGFWILDQIFNNHNHLLRVNLVNNVLDDDDDQMIPLGEKKKLNGLKNSMYDDDEMGKKKMKFRI